MRNNFIKTILFLSLYFISSVVWAQNKVTIHGELTRYTEKAIIYFDYSVTDSIEKKASQRFESVELVGNSFKKEMLISDPTLVVMLISPTGKAFSSMSDKDKAKLERFEFFVENGDYYLKSNGTFAELQLEPMDKMNEEYIMYHDLLSKWTNDQQEVVNRYAQYIRIDPNGKPVSIDGHVSEECHGALGVVNERNVTDVFHFAKKYNESYIGLTALKMAATNSNAFGAELVEVLNSYSQSLQETLLWKKFKEILGGHVETAVSTNSTVAMKVTIGDKAPVFDLKNAQGKKIKLSKYKGTYTLVNFWASWSEPSRAEISNLKKTYDTFKGKKFNILGVSLDEKYLAWMEAVMIDGVEWEQVADIAGYKSKVAKQYGVSFLPQNVLIDPNGIIIATNLNGQALLDKLAEIL